MLPWLWSQSCHVWLPHVVLPMFQCVCPSSPLLYYLSVTLLYVSRSGCKNILETICYVKNLEKLSFLGVFLGLFAHTHTHSEPVRQSHDCCTKTHSAIILSWLYTAQSQSCLSASRGFSPWAHFFPLYTMFLPYAGSFRHGCQPYLEGWSSHWAC